MRAGTGSQSRARARDQAPKERLAEVRAAIESLEDREDQFNRRVEEFEARGRQSRRQVTEDEAHALRVAAIRELGKLMPVAKRQARQGKPALLRMILRASR